MKGIDRIWKARKKERKRERSFYCKTSRNSVTSSMLCVFTKSIHWSGKSVFYSVCLFLRFLPLFLGRLDSSSFSTPYPHILYDGLYRKQPCTYDMVCSLYTVLYIHNVVHTVYVYRNCIRQSIQRLLVCWLNTHSTKREMYIMHNYFSIVRLGAEAEQAVAE